ncbi:hypothetical protein, conserved [Eimeria brunetti]|uniref:Uncharacterized protein n=1 Tax=Eimeria brunetti TaxID=51314 RepID=U6LER0_9EIME|nr:hypothetical protein, conserved [Eimeria brunetti]
MYSGEESFSGFTLSRLLQAFPNTVEAFFCAAPLEWQDELASAVLRCLVQAWCLLLADWGYGGHYYESAELEVLETDLGALRQYIIDNEIAMEDEGEMLDRANDFLVMLDADGRCLAAAEYLSRQQQHEGAPQFESAADNYDKNRKKAVGPSVGPLPLAGVAVSMEAAAESRNSSPRRGRGLGSEGPSAEGKRRGRSKGKGWGGVGRWVKGVYGSSARRSSSSSSSRRREGPNQTELQERNYKEAQTIIHKEERAQEPRETPRRALRFAI